MTRRRSLKRLNPSTYERGIVHRAHERELNVATGAAGDTMHFALLVADEAIVTEMDRVAHAIDTARAFLVGFDDNPYARDALRLLNVAKKRGAVPATPARAMEDVEAALDRNEEKSRKRRV